MLHALLRALRPQRFWKTLLARGCASDGAAGGPEIQVRGLEGPDQGITEILMNRPRARNALGNIFVGELLDALARLREDRQVRVLIFRSGVKGVFCADADLKEREQMSEAEVVVFVQRLRGMMNEIEPGIQTKEGDSRKAVPGLSSPSPHSQHPADPTTFPDGKTNSQDNIGEVPGEVPQTWNLRGPVSQPACPSPAMSPCPGPAKALRAEHFFISTAAFPAPTIAAVDGFALGGGLELALACDLRVAASSAVMGLIETTRGLLPGAGGTQRLPRCLGVALAKELIFTDRRLSGTQAQALGLVNHTVDQNEEGNAAYHRARALAQEILPQAPIAVRLGKVAIDRGMEVDIASGMAIEGMCYAQNIPTQDRLEGMAAFREKRPPKFVGE
ncbi:enoyl-CoA hydratase domain-containing protein 2, mitochondrial isoform X2 [Choloepus didactylus]|uniref:enoyl-CoA hydratase domain-containing protein 2, mitochondrial isoform X2 n=1 Tax=Choloepus didactylus TaxID=27675 RepID=UPI0018A0CF2F|nr:enoyl-CoA hydratase domain-containing protein 2, mitochondrial isoform X2 [Choloepus didactylus]